MIGTGAARPRSIFEHLSGTNSADWRAVVYAAGYALAERAAPLNVIHDLEAVLARAEAADADLGRELRDVVNDAKTAVYDTALTLGVALARTWPARLEDLDAWPDRALALAELDRRAGPPAPIGRAPGQPSAAAPPFEGETIADVVERSGSLAEGPYGWLDLVLQTLWEESPHREEYRTADHQAVDLLEHRAPVPVEVFGRFDNVRVDEVCDATTYAGRLGYALGKYEHLPEPERIARARALANLGTRRTAAPPLGPDEWEAVRRSRPAAASADPIREQLGAWLVEHCSAGADPAEAVAALERDVPAMRARLGEPAPAAAS